MDKTTTFKNLNITSSTASDNQVNTMTNADLLPSKNAISNILNYSKSLEILKLKTTQSIDVILN